MIFQELKQCPNCGGWYAEYQLEEVFTGRTQRICYKCVRSGLNQTGIRLNSRKAVKRKKEDAKK